MRKKARGKVSMLLGGVCLIAALSLTLHNHAEESRAALAAQDALIGVRDCTENIAPASGDGPEMTAVTLGGSPYIGVLDIPAIDTSLPVIGEYSDDALKSAPCLYTGNYKENSMIVAGHNYKQHFAGLPALAVGDRVRFTDLSGAVYNYAVTAIETVGGADIEGMLRGDWDLTLFTCTYDGVNRVTVRCAMQYGTDAPAKS